MINEESNCESSFEIVDKKNDTQTGLISAASQSSGSSITNNLLSNVEPPSSIPDFKIWPSTSSTDVSRPFPPITTTEAYPISTQPILANNAQFPTTEFSAAIPPSKGALLNHRPGVQDASLHKDANQGGFMDLVKDAFSSGGVLSRMAEKAKNSVDSIITTLDPQMTDVIYSGGDTIITVTTSAEDEVKAIRDAAYFTFGKAWVNGICLDVPVKHIFSLGFVDGLNNANETINYSLKYRKTPTMAIERVILKENETWFEVNLLVLRDVEKNVTLQTLSQAIPIPLEEAEKDAEKNISEYKLLTTEQKLTKYIQSKPGWQIEVCGVSRKETLLLAGKVLLGEYRNKIGTKK